MANEVLISKKRLEELEAELNELKSVKRQEIIADLAEAKSHGDLSENSEYDEARDAQAANERRIADLEKLLSLVSVYDEDAVSTEVVSIGCRVTVSFLEDDETETYDLVSSGEADAMNNKLSDQSPLGMALKGHRVGEEIVANTPGGKIHMLILNIGKQDF